jgi:hypothetical protein
VLGPEYIVKDDDVVKDQTLLKLTGLDVSRDQFLDVLDTLQVLEELLGGVTLRVVIVLCSIDQKVIII